MKTLSALLAACLGLSTLAPAKESQHDLIIYGGTSAGIAAAIQASRMDMSVVIIEPTNRLGGLTTGGLGQTDIGRKYVIGGISREFYQGIRKHYANPMNWRWQKFEEYKSSGASKTTEDSADHHSRVAQANDTDPGGIDRRRIFANGAKAKPEPRAKQDVPSQRHCQETDIDEDRVS